MAMNANGTSIGNSSRLGFGGLERNQVDGWSFGFHGIGFSKGRVGGYSLVTFIVQGCEFQ